MVDENRIVRYVPEGENMKDGVGKFLANWTIQLLIAAGLVFGYLSIMKEDISVNKTTLSSINSSLSRIDAQVGQVMVNLQVRVGQHDVKIGGLDRKIEENKCDINFILGKIKQ